MLYFDGKKNGILALTDTNNSLFVLFNRSMAMLERGFDFDIGKIKTDLKSNILKLLLIERCFKLLRMRHFLMMRLGYHHFDTFWMDKLWDDTF